MEGDVKKYKFIDLFAGIGGFHIALSEYGAKCVFASEWDKKAANVYNENFGMMPAGDITQIAEEEIPPHDILCAGFPCQAFSVSGNQLGFKDTRGTLFFDIARIVKHHKPSVLLLENVKNLMRHDGGNTFLVIKNTLDELDYNVFHQVLNASDFGLPQNRERIFIVCFRKDIDSEKFKFPSPKHVPIAVENILEKNPNLAYIERNDISFYKNYAASIDQDGNEILLNKPIQIGIVNKGGQGERIYHTKGHGITLSAYGGGVGAKTGLFHINGKIRKLTPRECARMQGFPDSFRIDKSSAQAYKQFGNSVPINIVTEIVTEISKIIMMNEAQKLGSQTAKGGFRNEDDVVEKFKNWETEEDAQQWLKTMGYDLDDIEFVDAHKLSGHKTDVQVEVKTKSASSVDTQNLQVKLVSNLKGFNQIDKRWVAKYEEMWDIPNGIADTFKRFTGELPPTISNPKDKRRMFLNEFEETERSNFLSWLTASKKLIVSDILKGRGLFSAEWMLVVQKVAKNSRWVLCPMNICTNHFGGGEISMSPRGSIKIGNITMQRKGGDGGRPSANMLQFKINPAELFDL